MGKAYNILPIAICDIFSAIIAKVSENLASDTDLEIPQVNFMHGTFLDICNELKPKSKKASTKNVKYPLICLIYKTDERFTDKYNDEINVDLMICTGTSKDYTNDQRYANNIKPKLLPIYAELKAVIGNWPQFWGWKRKFPHTKTDLPHAGQESGSGTKAYELMDVIDAIYLKDCKFKVVHKTLTYEAPNVCLKTPCHYGTIEALLSVFKDVRFTGQGTNTLAVAVTDYDYFYNLGGLPAPFAPEIDWGAGGPVEALNDNLTKSKNISALANGFYIGNIYQGDAKVEFYYLINNGLVSVLTQRIQQTLEYDLACINYPNNPITANITYTVSSAIINGYTYNQFGTDMNSEVYSPAVATTTEENTTTTDYQAVNKFITHKISRQGGQSPLLCVSVLQTKCKTQF